MHTGRCTQIDRSLHVVHSLPWRGWCRFYTGVCCNQDELPSENSKELVADLRAAPEIVSTSELRQDEGARHQVAQVNEIQQKNVANTVLINVVHSCSDQSSIYVPTSVLV